tara:strand:+ start:1165 stop:2679 length:1515 start_codon:yes stop_codon:yes gene_type:complete
VKINKILIRERKRDQAPYMLLIKSHNHTNMKISILMIISIFAPLLIIAASQNVRNFAYKDLNAEVTKLDSYYLKAEQSSEIAQTRYQRGLFSMSELSALRAVGQFKKADESIDDFISKVAGANLTHILPWNKKRYKQKLLALALELRLRLAIQEEDLESLLGEVEKQLEDRQEASIQMTLNRMDSYMERLNQQKTIAPLEQLKDIEGAITILRNTKSAILDGVQNEMDISQLIEGASRVMQNLDKSKILSGENISAGPRAFDDKVIQSGEIKPPVPSQASLSNSLHSSSASTEDARIVDQVQSEENRGANLEANSGNVSQNSIPNKPTRETLLKNRSSGLNFSTEEDSAFSTIETVDGRKIRVSRPPRDWPNGQATGYDSVYDDRPGGNLIKEEEIVFERIQLNDGEFAIKEIDHSRKERKWNFSISETGGVEDRYSIANLGNYKDFEIKSWVLRNQSREIVDRLDGNNLDFSPSNLADGDYSLEVVGITGWSSPFKVAASVLR